QADLQVVALPFGRAVGEVCAQRVGTDVRRAGVRHDHVGLLRQTRVEAALLQGREPEVPGGRHDLHRTSWPRGVRRDGNAIKDAESRGAATFSAYAGSLLTVVG